MTLLRLIGITLLIGLFTGCATAPPTSGERTILQDKADVALKVMGQVDPTLPGLLKDAYGYAVFPSASKGGLIAGGAYGRGVVYEQGIATGFADVAQASIGGQIGAQTFSQLVVLQDKAAMDRFKSGKLTFETNVSAIALDQATAQRAQYKDGVIVFVRPEGGVMAEATIGGQQFTYMPAD